MAKRKIEGTCCICGVTGPLTYEHIPPEAAFNDEAILEADVDQLIAAQTIQERDAVRKRKNQRGAGAHTLCASCNSNTGAWYVPAYIRWAQQGWKNLYHQEHRIHHRPFEIEPLLVAKQIMAMFASACGSDLFGSNPGLCRFVLNRDQSGLPPEFQIFAYYIHPFSSASRQSGITANLDLEDGASPSVYSEIAFPPFGYVLCLNRTRPPNERLVDITFMAHDSSKGERTLNLQLPPLPVNSFLPGDYRSQLQIDAAYR